MDFLKELPNFFAEAWDKAGLMLLVYFGVAMLLTWLLTRLLSGGGGRKAKKDLKEKNAHVGDLEMKLGNVEKEMSIQDADMKRLSLELKSISDQNASLQKEKNNLTAQLRGVQDRENTMKASIEDATSKYESANLKINQLASELDAGRANSDGYQARVLELENRIAELEGAKAKEGQENAARLLQMQKSYDSLQVESANAVEENRNQNAELNSLKSQLLGLRRENDLLSGIKDKYDRQKEGFKDLLLKQNEFIIRIEKLKENLKELEEQNEQLANASGGNSDEYNNQVQELSQKLEAAHNNLSLLESEKSGMSSELEEYKSKASELEKEKYILEEEYNAQLAINAQDARSVESSNSELEAKIDELENQLKAALAANDELAATAKREKHDLRLELETLKATYDAAKSGDLAAGSGDLEKEISDLKSQLIRLRTERNVEEQSQSTELEDAKSNFEEALQAEKHNMAMMRVENAQLKEQLSGFEAKISSLEIGKFEAEEDVDELEDKYQSQLEMLNSQLSDARDENMRLLMQLGEIPNGNEIMATPGVGDSSDYGDESLIREIELLREHLSVLQTEKFEAEEDADLIEDKYQAQLEALNAQLSKARDENMQLQMQMQGSDSTEMSAASASHDDYLKEIDALKAEIAQLETERFEAEEDNTSQDDNHQASLDALNSQLSGVRDENMQLQEAITNLKNKISHLETAKFEAEEDGDEADAKHGEQLTAINKQLSSVRDENMRLQIELDEAKTMISELEAVKFEAEEDGDEADAKHSEQLSIINTQLSNIKDENMRLQIELDEAKTLISELEAVKFEAEQEVDDMVEDHSDVLTIENKKLAAARDENMRLIAQVNDLKLKLQQVNHGNLVVAGGSSSSGTGIDSTDAVGKNAVSDLFGNLIPQANASNKDDLKKIDGIGAFIEEKLNKIGIYTFEQISFFDDEIIEKVTDAIQFFPGRIKKDKWVEQSKALMGQNKGKLNVIEAQAMIRASIGRNIPKANADDKNNLKVIKGIGAFIEQKLNKLGIYTYEQVAAFDDNMIETITTAIEFFPDRIKRDGWVEQARKLAGK